MTKTFRFLLHVWDAGAFWTIFNGMNPKLLW